MSANITPGGLSQMIAKMEIDPHDTDERKSSKKLSESGSVKFGASTISSLSQDATTNAPVSSSTGSEVPKAPLNYLTVIIKQSKRT